MKAGWGLTIPLQGVALPEQAGLLRALPDWGFSDVWSSEVAGAAAAAPPTSSASAINASSAENAG